MKQFNIEEMENYEVNEIKDDLVKSSTRNFLIINRK